MKSRIILLGTDHQRVLNHAESAAVLAGLSISELPTFKKLATLKPINRKFRVPRKLKKKLKKQNSFHLKRKTKFNFMRESKLSDYRQKTIIARDKITGFVGTIVGHSDYITGCDQYLLTPSCESGEYKEGRWFDEARIAIVEVKETLIDENHDNGADISAPKK